MVVKEGVDGGGYFSFFGEFVDCVEASYLEFKLLCPRSEKFLSFVVKFLLAVIVASAFLDVTNLNKTGLWWVLHDPVNVSELVLLVNVSSNVSFNVSDFCFESVFVPERLRF